MTDILARICADKLKDIERRKAAQPLAKVEAAARHAPAVRGFARKLRATVSEGGYALIAEIKKASPSHGLIRADFDAPTLARAYERGGASCLSVLTDEPYFQGKDDDLAQARAAGNLPVLRKDFMLDPYQVVEARALGADCILLIMAALGNTQAEELASAAHALAMDVLIEVHDQVELTRALRIKSELVGINNRNLSTLSVDLATTERLAPQVPIERLAVAESGLKTANDLRRLAKSGARAFLVGESLMRQPDVTLAVRALLSTTPALEAAGR
ncbi:MAG: indole-3-glycerol phosphate synthase TrpC [Rhodospirillaceae bacterium]|nr:indole-3-glycerol phosphate synthase TrpC [Rhodospirillaceae bacterium]